MLVSFGCTFRLLAVRMTCFLKTSLIPSVLEKTCAYPCQKRESEPETGAQTQEDQITAVITRQRDLSAVNHQGTSGN